jgi:hypothetical protein
MKLIIHNSQTGNLIVEKSKTYSKMKLRNHFGKNFRKFGKVGGKLEYILENWEKCWNFSDI